MGIVRDFHVQVRQYSCYQKLVCILVCALVAAVGVSTDGRDFFLFMSLRRGSSKHLKGYESKDVLIMSGDEWNYALVSVRLAGSH